MNIGIIGMGIVGNACKFGFEKLGHEVNIHDLKLQTTIQNVLTSTVVFICVPTPSNLDGTCNTEIVESVVDELIQKKYSGIICIKSTVSPGTTQKLIDKYDNKNICMVPEFLRERYALSDFTENHDICIIGTVDENCFNTIQLAHGNLPKHIFKTSPTEAELSKYFNNTYNSTLITFANSFFEICKHFNTDYTKIKNMLVYKNNILDMYLECNENFRGFAGVCLPKDTKEIANIGEKINVNFFKYLLLENDKYKKTVIGNMRAS